MIQNSVTIRSGARAESGGEIVRDGRVLGQPGSHRGKFVAHALRRDVRIWIFLRHLDQQVDIENARIEEVGHAVPVALFPMLHQVLKQRNGPVDAPFEKAETELREAPHDAAEEQCLAKGLAGSGEGDGFEAWNLGRHFN